MWLSDWYTIIMLDPESSLDCHMTGLNCSKLQCVFHQHAFHMKMRIQFLQMKNKMRIVSVILHFETWQWGICIKLIGDMLTQPFAAKYVRLQHLFPIMFCFDWLVGLSCCASLMGFINTTKAACCSTFHVTWTVCISDFRSQLSQERSRMFIEMNWNILRTEDPQPVKWACHMVSPLLNSQEHSCCLHSEFSSIILSMRGTL